MGFAGILNGLIRRGDIETIRQLSQVIVFLLVRAKKLCGQKVTGEAWLN